MDGRSDIGGEFSAAMNVRRGGSRLSGGGEGKGVQGGVGGVIEKFDATRSEG